MESLFARHVPKRGRIAVMLVGSLVIHGGLVGIGALFRQPQPDKVDVSWVPPGDGDPTAPSLPPEIAPPVDANPEPTATPNVIEPDVYAPPVPADVQNFAEPPDPTPRQRHATTKPTAAVRANNAIRSTSTSAVPGSGTASVPGGNLASGTTAAPWVMPHPPYPASLHSASAVSVTVRITTDAAGRIADVVVARSTGNAALDMYTISRVRGTWHGPANASRTTEFVYQLR